MPAPYTCLICYLLTKAEQIAASETTGACLQMCSWLAIHKDKDDNPETSTFANRTKRNL